MTEKALLMKEKKSYGFSDLEEIVEILRGEGGCPWDREQNHRSIRNDFIEETYEAVEAIDKGDAVLLREELGDVLLQVVFHAVLAKEDGEFSVDDVCGDICKKLIDRHPHVFAETQAETTEQVLVNWDRIKNAEKSRNTLRRELDEVAVSLPSLIRSQKIAKRLIKAGKEEKSGESITENELGERLFLLTKAAHENGINAEQALYNYCNKIIEEKTGD